MPRLINHRGSLNDGPPDNVTEVRMITGRQSVQQPKNVISPIDVNNDAGHSRH